MILSCALFIDIVLELRKKSNDVDLAASWLVYVLETWKIKNIVKLHDL